MAGLIRGVARTAAIAGTATAVSGNVARRQNQRWAAQEQAQYAAAQPVAAPAPAPVVAAPPAPPVAAGIDIVAELTKLAELKAAGILSEEEFSAAKAKLLG